MIDILESGLALSASPGISVPWWQSFGAVLNVCDIAEPEYLPHLPPNCRLIRQPFEDTIPAPLAFLRAATLELAECRQRGLTTLVHCQAGQSRSPSIIALYWMGRDGLAWDAAIERIRRVRRVVDPHPQLVSLRVRAQVASEVRRFLDGETEHLHLARQRAAALLTAHETRGPSASSDVGWDAIEPGLACGSRDALVSSGYERALDLTARVHSTASVAGCGLREDGVLDPIACQVALAQLDRWRREGRSVIVCCPDGKSLSALIVALHLMSERGWDFTEAMWYIRQRRRGAWPRTASLQALGLV